MANNDQFIKEIFGLNRTNVRETHELASKDSLLPVKDMKDKFHVYTNAGFLEGNENCHILIPQNDSILEKIRPDRLQWYELYGFFNLLSTLDLSLSVPFIEIKWRDYNPADSAHEKEQDKKVLKKQGERTLGDVIDDPALYFQPQTYYKSSINKFRPFIGIKSFDVEIKNPIGMIATKYATLQLTLFDITKLAKARDFIYPGDRAPTLEITYGWSHPHIDKTFQSSFINTLRDTAMWRVANYNVSINQNNTANITLELFSLAAHRIVRANLIPNATGLEELSKAAREAQLAQEKEQKYLNSLIADGSLSKRQTKRALVNVEQLNKTSPALEIIGRKKFKKKEVKVGGDIQVNIAAQVYNTKKALALGTKEHLGELFKKLFLVIEKSKNKKRHKGQGLPGSKDHIVLKFEEFIKKSELQKSFIEIARTGKEDKKIKDNPRTYLGLLLMYIFGVSVPKARGEHENVETQLIFYNFNAKSIGTNNKNIASFIIHNTSTGGARRHVGFVDQVNKYILKTKIQNPPIHDIFAILNNDYLSNPVNKNFGWDINAFDTKQVKVGKSKKGEKQRTVSVVTGAGEKFFDQAKKAGFVQPSVKMHIVEGPAKGDPKLIIRRVFIYDEAESTSKTELLALRKKIAERGDDATVEEAYQEIRSEIPFVQVGTERSIVKNVTLNTINDPLLQTIFMQRIAPSTDGDNTQEQKHIPAQFLPMTAEIETFGFPNIMFGSKLFIDLRTKTTVDNIYRITGIRHSFTPQTIGTKLSLTPDDAWLHIKIEDEDEEFAGPPEAGPLEGLI